jgi:hypothetical protein
VPITSRDFKDVVHPDPLWQVIEGEWSTRDFFESNCHIAWASISADLGKLTAEERRFVNFQFTIHTERALRKQQLIQADLAKARSTGDLALYQQCRKDLRKLNRQHWNVGSAVKSKILVRRKGTERSRSRTGSQTICTHVLPIFEADLEGRWLFGLAVEFSRAADARNGVNRSVLVTAQTEALGLKTQYFANVETDVRQSKFRTQVSAATLFRERKQMGANRLRRDSDFPSGGENYHRYSFDWCQRVCRYDTLPVRMVRLCNLDSGNGHLRMAPCLFSTS